MGLDGWRIIVTALAVLLVIGQYGLTHWESRQKRAESEAQEERRIAQYVVLAMTQRFPVKDSKDFDQRTGHYLDALRRAKAEGRGVPVYREDGSIGVEWSMSLGDTLRFKDSLNLSSGPKGK